MSLDYIEIGKRLKTARGKLTQQKLAELLGVSASYVKKTERGGKPSLEYLSNLVSKSSVSLDWLLLGIGKAPDENFNQEIFDELNTINELFSSDPLLKPWLDIINNMSFKDINNLLAIRHTLTVLKKFTAEPIGIQKNEVVFDPDLKRMVDILKELMSNENPHMRSWAIIQFEKAFAEYCSSYDEKKLHA